MLHVPHIASTHDVLQVGHVLREGDLQNVPRLYRASKCVHVMPAVRHVVLHWPFPAQSNNLQFV
jgi:hypothetical protein